MRLLINLLILSLVIICVAPFFIKRHDGRPLINFSKPNLLNKLPILSRLPTLREIIPSSRSKPDTAPSKSYTKVYKWKDKNGVLHFSDRKNANDPCEVISVKTNIPDTGQGKSNDFAKLKEFKNNYLKTDEKKDFLNKDIINKDLINNDLINEDLINMLFPTTIPITQIPKLIKDAQGLEQLLENKYKEQLRIINEQ